MDDACEATGRIGLGPASVLDEALGLLRRGLLRWCVDAVVQAHNQTAESIENTA